MAERIEARVADKGIDLILSAKINSITSQNGKKILSLPDQQLKVDFVFFATGSRPNVGLAEKAGLKIGETGGILVNKYLQTSDPDIYAIGDCAENWDAILGIIWFWPMSCPTRAPRCPSSWKFLALK